MYKLYLGGDEIEVFVALGLPCNLGFCNVVSSILWGLSFQKTFMNIESRLFKQEVAAGC